MGPIFTSLRPSNTVPFEEMSQRWQVLGHTVFNLTGLRFEPQTSRSRDRRVTARPASWSNSNAFIFGGSHLGPVILDSMLQTARHRRDISSKRAGLHGRNDAEIRPANSLHTLAYYRKYNKRFDAVTLLNSFLIGTS